MTFDPIEFLLGLNPLPKTNRGISPYRDCESIFKVIRQKLVCIVMTWFHIQSAKVACDL